MDTEAPCYSIGVASQLILWYFRRQLKTEKQRAGDNTVTLELLMQRPLGGNSQGVLPQDEEDVRSALRPYLAEKDLTLLHLWLESAGQTNQYELFIAHITV